MKFTTKNLRTMRVSNTLVKYSVPCGRGRPRSMVRRATSLIEVILGLILVTMLMVPAVGLMSASARIWRQFESGHGSVASRQIAMQEIGSKLRNASQVLSLSNRQIRFRSVLGDVQTITQRGSQVLWQHAGASDLIADGIGTLRLRRVARSGTPLHGEVIEIRVQNPPRSGVANSQSTSSVWIRPSI